jgi:SAM-dependent methyltransferase
VTTADATRRRNDEPGSQRAVVAYVGKERVHEVPAGVIALGDWDVLPNELRPCLDRASALIILDVLSFPFEAMHEEHRDIPFVAVLPPTFDLDALVQLFDEPLFRHVTPFDRFVVADDRVWLALAERYCWAREQRILPTPRDLTDLMGRTVADIECTARLCERMNERGSMDPLDYWRWRGSESAMLPLPVGTCSPRHDLRDNKAMHLMQSHALRPVFARVLKGAGDDHTPRVLEVGTGLGRWAASFPARTVDFTGADISPDALKRAKINFPDATFARLSDELTIPLDDESVDLAFTVTVLHHNRDEAKVRLVRDMWRVVKPGGALVFLEDFVASRSRPGANVFPLSMSGFIELLLEATRWRVAVDNLDALRYPRDAFHRAGLVAVTKLAVPKVA